MDAFAKLPAEERHPYFEQAPIRLGYLTPQLVEKDFWVCWTLRRIFQVDGFKDHLTFKGGTSLSKVYHLIERFSEDIDLSIEREYLGFGGDREPEAGKSGKEQQRRVADLRNACQKVVETKLLPELKRSFESTLSPDRDWQLSLDENDPDRQPMFFKSPPDYATMIDELRKLEVQINNVSH